MTISIRSILRNSSHPARSSSARGAESLWQGILWEGRGCSVQTDAAGPTTAGGAESEGRRKSMKTPILKNVPVSELKPAAYNPRRKLKAGDKEYEKIKNSILEFGFADPLVVNADMTIIGGHQRLTVAKDLGYT